MSITNPVGTRQAATLPLRHVLPRLLRDPVNALADFGRAAGGELVRINLGPIRPYLVSHPDHVQHVLRGNWTNYVRDGMFWKPLSRLSGDSIISDGPGWESSRKILQPLFTARYVDSLAAEMAESIEEGIDALDRHTAQVIDVAEEMARIVNQAVIRVLFGNRVSPEKAERLAPAYATAASSFAFRIFLPFVPDRVPLPGDRAFWDAAKTIDDVVYPLVRQARLEENDGRDIISALSRARSRDESGNRQMRDDLVSIYGAAAETTAMALTWLWPLLDAHPQVAERLYAEIDQVVGTGPVTPDHLLELRYLKMVLQELLRLYPSGWLFPRVAAADDEIAGIPIKAGSDLLISPYVTHRLDEFWERPLEFDPERFSPDVAERRHRYAYFPFGGGPHVCLGLHLFYVEAPLLLATLLSRFRPRLVDPGPYQPFPAGSVRPRRKVEMTLHRREGR
ncbi:cytochrome P450 [Acrocarpospora sp. B8E8]|uniref:cytochrome P450 n=1 Tax=Acrocarpospora sp. B8E8 TaxID=3153572 RepID=UPI00325D0F79